MSMPPFIACDMILLILPFQTTHETNTTPPILHQCNLYYQKYLALKYGVMSLVTQQTHFKGVTLHLSARIIAWSPAPAEIE
jgi:hypothetical protein